MSNNIDHLISERISTLKLFKQNCAQEISQLADALVSIFENGKKLLICGNGGSAADSQHFAAEFVSSFSVGLKRKSLPAISLSVDTSIISAISNDFGYEHVFSRQIEGLGSPGDALLIISTSGKSRNCLAALSTAKKMQMKTLALTSKDSVLFGLVDLAIGVPSKDTQLVQECHVIAYHIIAELVDRFFEEE